MSNYLNLTQFTDLVKTALYRMEQHLFWVVAEIAELKASGRGHVYLELVEKDKQQLTAKSQAVIWYNKHQEIRQKFGRDTYNILKKGNKVLLLLRLDYHAIYGLKVVIEDVDASVTIGDLELRRLEMIQQLQTEGAIGLNQQHVLPSVLQRIAVISSPTAAGYGDFVNHLQQNPYGYRVHYQLFEAAMQGEKVEPEVLAKLQRIAQQKERFDAVVIIRGGGSKLDLNWFNNYKLAQTIAHFPLPVLTGIGHQQDETVCDLVAHTALKTPTAVAEFILNSFLVFESNLQQLIENLQFKTQQILHIEQSKITNLNTRFQLATQHLLQQQKQQLSHCETRLERVIPQFLQRQRQQLAIMEQAFKFLSIENLLKRGFSITRLNGKVLTDSTLLQKGDVLETQLEKGSLKSIVGEVKQDT